MRACIQCQGYEKSYENSPQHSNNPTSPPNLLNKLTIQYPPFQRMTMTQRETHTPTSSIKLEKLKKSLKRSPKMQMTETQKQKLIWQSDPYMIKQENLRKFSNPTIPPIIHQFSTSREVINYKNPQIKVYQNQRLIKLRKNQSNHFSVRFNIMSPVMKPVSEASQIESDGSQQLSQKPELKKSYSVASLADSAVPRISLKRPSVSQQKNSIISFKEQQQMNLLEDEKNLVKQTFSRNPEERTTDNQYSMRNTHLNIQKYNKGQKMQLYKSAIHLDAFKCVNAESVGAESQSSEHYSQVIQRTTNNRWQKPQQPPLSLLNPRRSQDFLHIEKTKFSMKSERDASINNIN